MMRKISISFVFVAIVMAMIVPPAQLWAQESLRTSRVLAPINEHQVVTLGGHLMPWATSANDQGVAPDNIKLDLHIMLKRSDAQEAALQKLMAEQQNQKSANYRKWLTPEEYGARFGVSDADLAKVTAWLTAHGFTVEKVAKGNNVLLFSGTSAQVKQALHTTLHQYKVGSEFHYANASNPMVPAALAPVISGFYGLNDMKPKPLHTRTKVAQVQKGAKGWQVTSVKSAETGYPNGAKSEFEWTDPMFGSSWHLLAPGDFATIYNVTPLYNTYDGTGQTIAIVSGSDIDPRDVDNFRANFNLPGKKYNVFYAGPNPGLVAGVEGEADLDVEWSGAIAPGATVDLVVSPDVTSSIVYIVDNDLANVMSISYGQCELGLQMAGNAYFSELYKQASSQGITVLAAAGDSGSDTCDQGQSVSSYGLNVSGWASTPYNTAVGGTDFPVNVMGQATDYWNSTNISPDLHSALKYVPEAPWNDTCASPEVLAVAQTYPDWAADTTNELLCNDPNAPFVSTVGGGGGASNCTNTDTFDPTKCTAGYPQPAWQSGVPGVPSDSRRHLPDVSFFAGSGMWETAYMFCESDATSTGACDLTNPDDVRYNLAGGTSFASPAFAGIVALLNQKTGSRLGNINYTLYQLAATQFADQTLKDACKADSTAGTDSCIFHDITQGNNSVPCMVGTTDNPPDGKCSVTNSSDQLGVLSGYDAGDGYDDASGLGSINAYNLISNWPGSLAATQTTLTLSSASVNYGMNFGGTVKVTAGSGTPTGTVALMYKDSNGNARAGWAASDLNNGTASVTSVQMPVGAYKVYARYPGDATYGASVSAEQSVTVSQAVTTVDLKANRTSVGETERAQLMATIKAPSFGSSPTGSVVFKNATTGAVIDTVQVTAFTDSSTGYSYAQAMTSAGAGVLTHGSNQITATYTGDTNYATAVGSSPAVQYTGGFSITASSSALTLGPGATSGNTVALTLTPSSGVTLSPSAISFSCPGTLPAGVTCQFSTPTAGTNGTVSSTLTLALNSPLAQNSPVPLLPIRHGLGYLAMMIVGGVFVAVPRKRSAMIATILILALMAVFSFGCGGSSKSTTPAAPTMTTTLTVSSAAPALNSPVTLKATLSNPAGTGTISFFDGTNLLGSAAVSNGAASLTTSSLPVGARTLTAAYSGDSKYPAATSAAVSVDVMFSSTITALAVDSKTGNLAQQSVSLTVK